ncbi:homeobox-leucine zipper protein ROC9 [Hordeum vulgare]|nr:homeobox-leucine zipper protein ROC9 [Hordeum vulgare]
MGSSRPRTKDFFAVPTLSLSLAGAFARNAPAATSGDEVEEDDEGSGGIRSGPLGEEVEISSENKGPAGSQSGDGSGEEEEGHDDGGKRKKRSRKSYHRHTAEQVRVMEAVFKESPHPDEKQRQQLSKQLGLSPRQVKFWFQNRRTQIKAVQERHENSLLKSELENLQKENRAMRQLTKRPSSCPSCGAGAASSDGFDAAAASQEQQLQLENAKLRAEVEKLRGALGTAAADGATSPASSPFSAATAQMSSNRSPLEVYGGGFAGRDMQSVLELAGRALEELKMMASSGEPLWVRSVETGRDILNYDEYVRLFRRDDGPADRQAGWSVEASRETGVVYLDATKLVHAFMDVNEWKELFPSMVARASTLDVIRTGDDDDGHDGVVQLMFAEVQMLTPMVPTREFYFARYCKKLAAEKWAIVDVSFDKAEADVGTSPLVRCWKDPSGCIIEEQANGHSRVTWVEHTRLRECAAPSMYRAVTAGGLAFGARRWVATLQLQCERMVFWVATNVPTRDSSGVSTLAGRRSVLKLAHRMTSSLCRVIGGSRGLAWSRAPRAGAGDLRLTSRTNAGDPGEPQGLIACAVLSAWLPVSTTALLDFLRDESRRPEWDVTLAGRAVHCRVNLTKGKDRGNCVTAYAPASAGGHGGEWIVQDGCTSPCESIVAYAPVDAAVLQPVISGHDSSGLALLPCGFAVVPDGLESRPAVITARKEDGAAAGSLVTAVFQVLASSSPVAALSPESAETVTSLASCTLRRVRKAFGCEDR